LFFDYLLDSFGIFSCSNLKEKILLFQNSRFKRHRLNCFWSFAQTHLRENLDMMPEKAILKFVDTERGKLTGLRILNSENPGPCPDKSGKRPKKFRKYNSLFFGISQILSDFVWDFFFTWTWWVMKRHEKYVLRAKLSKKHCLDFLLKFFFGKRFLKERKIFLQSFFWVTYKSSKISNKSRRFRTLKIQWIKSDLFVTKLLFLLKQRNKKIEIFFTHKKKWIWLTR